MATDAIRAGILSTAGALGIDPLDLATAISYETAGTFDPVKRGPTTQWGQHRGLIQFGEPQARQHGVNWDDPIGSQLGPDGAVASYLRGAGVKPGMGLLDVYSAINAGAPGLYDRSDANNGGAPGTVRDKVEQQMAGHRRNAESLLGVVSTSGTEEREPAMAGLFGMAGGGQEQPQEQARPRRGLLGLDRDRSDMIAMALSGMTMNPNEGLMRALAGRMENRREDARLAEARQLEEAEAARAAQEEAARRNRTIEYLRGVNPELAEAVASGVVSAGDAFKMAREQPELKTTTIDGRLVNSQTGDVIADFSDQDEMTTAMQTLKQRAREAGLEPGTEAYRQFMVQGGAANGMAFEVAPDGTVRFSQGGEDFELNEGQSKSLAYYTRAAGAAPTLDELEQSLTSLGGAVLDRDPTGLARGQLQSPEYQQARNAADEFLQAILRKDTGAAITADEQELYGRTYIPQPGDGPEVIAQKRAARARALEAIRQGIPAEAMVQQERQMTQSRSGQADSEMDFNAPTAPDGLSPDDADLWRFATPEERRAIWGNSQ